MPAHRALRPPFMRHRKVSILLSSKASLLEARRGLALKSKTILDSNRIGGQQLASRAQLQALKFGVQFAISRETVTIQQVDGIHKLLLAGGIPVCARAVVVATGAQYRKLTVENYENSENRGLFYAATPMESILCKEKDVIVIGGGNSRWSGFDVSLGHRTACLPFVRGPSLVATMSQYLVSRIESSSRISLCTNCEIVALEGEPTLQSVTWVNRSTGERIQKEIEDVFVMIGAEPNTGWLYGTVALDKKGFILTESPAALKTPVCDQRPRHLRRRRRSRELGQARGFGCR